MASSPASSPRTRTWPRLVGLAAPFCLPALCGVTRLLHCPDVGEFPGRPALVVCLRGVGTRDAQHRNWESPGKVRRAGREPGFGQDSLASCVP